MADEKNKRRSFAIFIVVIFLLAYYWNYEGYIVKRSADGKQYYVKDYEHAEEAANMLSKINHSVADLVTHLKNKYGKDHPNVRNILNRYNPDVIYEHTPSSFANDVAYTTMKGKSLYICLRDTDKQLHSLNVIMFVALHELSHIATDARGHPREFWRTFKWILQEADEINIYDPVNYRIHPANYCGDMMITYNPLNDVTL